MRRTKRPLSTRREFLRGVARAAAGAALVALAIALGRRGFGSGEPGGCPGGRCDDCAAFDRCHLRKDPTRAG